MIYMYMYLNKNFEKWIFIFSNVCAHTHLRDHFFPLSLVNFFYSRIHSVFYLISLITITLSAVVGSTTSDPSVYGTSALQNVRAICEIWSLGTVIVTLLFELNQLFRYVRTWFIFFYKKEKNTKKKLHTLFI